MPGDGSSASIWPTPHNPPLTGRPLRSPPCCYGCTTPRRFFCSAPNSPPASRGSGPRAPGSAWKSSRPQEVLEPNRQSANTHTGSVEYRVGDGCIGADIAKLTQPFHSGGIDQLVLLAQHQHVHRTDVGVHRNEVVLQVAVDRARRAQIQLGLLMQCRTHPPYQATHELAACGARVDDAAGRKRAEDPGYPNLSSQRVHAHFDELGPERKHRLLTLRGSIQQHGLAGIQLLDGIRRSPLRYELGILLDDPESRGLEQIRYALRSAPVSADSARP